MLRDRFGDLVEIQAESLGLHDKLLEFLLKQIAPLGWRGRLTLGDDGTQPRMHLDQSFGDKLRDHFVCGIGVDFEGFAESADRGKGLARAHLAGDDSLFGGIDHLLVKGHARPKRNAKRNHRLYYNR